MITCKGTTSTLDISITTSDATWRLNAGLHRHRQLRSRKLPWRPLWISSLQDVSSQRFSVMVSLSLICPACRAIEEEFLTWVKSCQSVLKIRRWLICFSRCWLEIRACVHQPQSVSPCGAKKSSQRASGTYSFTWAQLSNACPIFTQTTELLWSGITSTKYLISALVSKTQLWHRNSLSQWKLLCIASAMTIKRFPALKSSFHHNSNSWKDLRPAATLIMMKKKRRKRESKRWQRNRKGTIQEIQPWLSYTGSANFIRLASIRKCELSPWKCSKRFRCFCLSRWD